MNDDELREGLDRLLRPAREAAPPGITLIRRRLRRRRARLAATCGGVAAAVGLLALVVGSHVGAPPAVTPATGRGGTHQLAYSYTVSSPVRNLDISADASSVTVTGGAAGSPVTVTDQLAYSQAEPSLRSSVQNGTLTLGYSCPAGQECGVSYDVRVPSGTDVTVRVQTGSIDLTGLAGAVIAATGTGTINASLASSDISLSVQTGQISANLTRPPADLSLSNGTGGIIIAVPGKVSYNLNYNLDVDISTIKIKQNPVSPYRIDVTSSGASTLYIGTSG